MKKLGKKLNSTKETLQAYSCSCSCMCSCSYFDAAWVRTNNGMSYSRWSSYQYSSK